MQSGVEREVTCPILVGRGPSMEIMRARLDSAAAGRGATLLVAAEAGVGKSRLVREAVTEARRRGFLPLQGNSFENEQSLPFAPFIDLLRSFSSSSAYEEYGSILGGHASDLARILPDEPGLRLNRVEPAGEPPGRLGRPATDDGPSSTRNYQQSTINNATERAPALGPEDDKHRLINVFGIIFAQLASHRPLMILLEDVHWSDDISLELFLHLARRAPQQRILLVATYRDDESRPALLHTLAELDRARLALEIRLAPLTPAEVDAMLRAIFDLHRPVQLDFLNKVYGLTEGNPFFVEEMLKSLLASGDIAYGDVVRDHNSLMDALVPRTVQDAVQRRSRLLSADAQRMLALAAVLGRRFSFDLLLALLGTGEAQLLALIKESIGAQLIVEESAEHFAFRHALTREAIYSQLLARERKSLHAEVARMLIRRQEQTHDITAAELARHSYAAGMWEKALAYARRAGEDAQALYAHGPAVEYFTMALEAALQMGISPEPGLYRARGLSNSILGNFDAAFADITEAVRLARQAGDRYGEWHSLLDLAGLWSSVDYRESRRFSTLALDLARNVDDPSTLAQTLNRVGNWWMNAYEPDEAGRHHQEALAIFEKLGDRAGIADTLGLLGFTYLFGLDLVQGASYLSRAIKLCREIDDRLGTAYYLAGLSLCAPSYATDTAAPAGITVQDALASAEEALQITRSVGWRSGESFANAILSDCYISVGDYEAAVACGQASLDIAHEIGHDEWIVCAHYCLGRAYADLLTRPQAILLLEEALAGARKIASTHWLLVVGAELALAYVAEGDLSRAGQILDSVMPGDTPLNAVGRRTCWVARAQLALAQSRPEMALSIADRLLSTAHNLSEEHIAPRLLKLRGDALAMLGDATGAEADLLRAVSTAQEQGLPPLRWRVELSLANLYRAQGNRTNATERYALARSVAEMLAVSIQEGELREGFLRRLDRMLPRPRPISPARAAKEAFGGLTAREREVAALVSQGLTNRQIGERLKISQETAAVHVKNILSKLNFTSRAQIAAWAAEHSL